MKKALTKLLALALALALCAGLLPMTAAAMVTEAASLSPSITEVSLNRSSDGRTLTAAVMFSAHKPSGVEFEARFKAQWGGTSGNTAILKGSPYTTDLSSQGTEGLVSFGNDGKWQYKKEDSAEGNGMVHTNGIQILGADETQEAKIDSATGRMELNGIKNGDKLTFQLVAEGSGISEAASNVVTYVYNENDKFPKTITVSEGEEGGGSGGEDKPVTVTHDLSIIYKDTYENQVAEPYKKAYAEGESYSVSSPAVSGLTPKTASVVGKMGTADISESVYYTLNDTAIKEVDETAKKISDLLPGDEGIGVENKEDINKAWALYDALTVTQKSYFREKYSSLYTKLEDCRSGIKELTTEYEGEKTTSGKKWKVTIFRKGKRTKTIQGDSLPKLYKKIAHIAGANPNKVKKVTLLNRETGKKTVVPKRNYRARLGSTFIDLDAVLLDPDAEGALESGTYNVFTTFEDGWAETEVSVDVATFDLYESGEYHDDILLVAGENCTFTSAYRIDGDTKTALAADAYVVEADSDVMTLKTAYLATLPVGEYKFGIALRYNGDEVVFEEEVTLTLTVVDTTPAPAPYGGVGGPATYKATITESLHGRVTVSPTSAASGAAVKITAIPDEGYELDTLTVAGPDGKPVELKQNDDGTWSFVQPAGKVTITASFKEKTPFANPFTDVAEGDYFYDAVLWAVRNGVTRGTTATTFSPYDTCTRGQFVTFLWRASGEPEPTITENPFTDVTADAYYSKAVLWAYEKGITQGMTETTFAPDAPVNRGQAVTFLWRWAGKPAAETVNPFTDVEQDAYYSDAVLWAYSTGVTQGMTPTTFAPDKNCLRGQVVTFLYRAVMLEQ